jgi:thioesterase domain-containing protein/acyl carrier protein
LGDIEAALSRHQAVRQAVVTAREDQQGIKQLVAYVVCQEGLVPSQADLRSYLHSQIPDYMLPSLFVFLAELPLTANNKIDRKALPAPTLAPSPAAVQIAPSDRGHVQMAALWHQAFGLKTIGIHDNFFDLGGHSLKAAQLFYLIEQVYGRHLPLSTLFQAPTIAALTSLLAHEQSASPWQSLITIQPNGSTVPIFLIPGVKGNVLGFAPLARLLSRTFPVYGLQPRGYDGNAEPFCSIPEMAQHYVEEIVACIPQGPYVIVGACTGGLVAYEMAQQLVARSAAVTLVVLNSWHPSSYQQYDTTLPRGLTSPRRLLSTVKCNLGALLRRIRERVEPGSMGLTEHDIRQRQLEHIRQAMYLASARYTMHPYQGCLLNIVTSQPVVGHDTRYDWGQMAREGCHTIQVAALRTADLVLSPHVEEISMHIQRFIAEQSYDSPLRPNNMAA